MIVLVAAMLVSAGCGGQPGDNGESDADVQDEDTELVAVPDVTGSEGDHAASEIEATGLTVTLAGSDDDEDIGDPRDSAEGCEVVDQTPGPMENAEPESEVELALDCRQADWDNQDGNEWSAWEAAFAEAATEGCEALFDLSPYGALRHDDTEYTATDCGLISAPDPTGDPPSEVPEDPHSAGSGAGFDAGCQAFFDSELIDAVYWGTDAYTAESCQAQNPHVEVSSGRGATDDPARRSRPRASAPGAASVASGACVGTAPDGTRFRIARPSGRIDCAAAKALWREYLRRTPTQGEGSGGAVDGIDGWGCISASAARAREELGSCDKAGSPDAFHVQPASR